MTWLVALAVASGATYALRAGAVRAFASRAMSSEGATMLRYASLCVMSWLACSQLPGPRGVDGLSLPVLGGVVVAIVLSRWLANMSIAMLASVVTYAALGALLGT